MTNKMLQFVDIGQQNPPKRDKSQRKEDFGEIYQEFIHDRAKEQSSRCSQCGVPFCQVHCPLSNNIPDWLKLTAEGRYEEALAELPEKQREVFLMSRLEGLTYREIAERHVQDAIRNQAARDQRLDRSWLSRMFSPEHPHPL